jgi:hypothetical protein
MTPSRLATLVAFSSLVLAFGVLVADAAPRPEAHASRFRAGDGPLVGAGGTLRLLDAPGSLGQSNAVAFDREHEGAHERVTVSGRIRVQRGGDGGAVMLLNTAEYGVRGPAPFVASWVEPNLRGSLAVGIDIHDPKNEEPFGEWGNYQGLPEREVSLHWDGREIVKRLAASEFRDDEVDILVDMVHVVGGAEVSVRIGEASVYERFFIPGLLPYECRLAVGAGTRPDASAQFDFENLALTVGAPAAPRRPPLHVEVFNHVLTDNSTTSYQAEVDLPPAVFSYGRVILTLDIHDAGADWDEWDRNGHLRVVTAEGEKWDIVPFITSYRTECHWDVDVTHFRSLLAGATTFEIAAGTTFYKNRGYMMSVSLDYYHGELDAEPWRVLPLWNGVARYGSAENHFRDFFTPRRLEIPPETVGAEVVMTTTGHSQVGEFTPSERTLVFAPEAGERAEERFSNTLWRNDCYLNPNRPQFGTWKYSRAGWAPGDVVRPWRIDLTPHLQPGKTAGFRYEPRPYDFGDGESPSQEEINKASHVVSAFLVLYREAGETIPAPTLRVRAVGPGSNAARAGVQVGDFLASYDGRRVDTRAALGEAKKAATDAGKEQVQAVLYRGAERLEVAIGTGQLGVNLSGP